MLLNNRIFKTLISCVLVLALSLSVMLPAFAAEGDETTLSFREQTAEEALNDWMDVFLMEQAIPGSDEPGLTSRRWNNNNNRTDFWISAIVFDSFSDVLEYGTDEEYKAEIEEVMYQLYRGFYYAAQQQWGSTYETNTYNDDVCWWAMVMERAYELTGREEYFDLAKKCIDRVIEDYDTTAAFGGEPYGGILWRWSNAIDITQNSKDTCANGNTSLTCARMSRVCAEKGMTEDAERYFNMAKAIYDWSEAHLIDDNGYVWNDVNYSGTRRNWQFTYCYGVSAGSAYELYKCTGDEYYLDRAITIMQYGFNTRTQGDGLTMVKEGDKGAGQNDDADAFKNIMLRIAAQMYHEGNAPQFEKYLNANAQQAYKNRRFSDGLINRDLAVMPSASEPCNSPCAIMAPSLLYWATLENEEDYPERIDPYAPVEGRYEAEDAYMSYVNTATDTADFTGTGYTQYWDSDTNHNADGYVEFTVDAEVAGKYSMDIRWYTRGNNTRRLSVNGSEPITVNFTRVNSNVWETKTVDVNLVKGENKIRFIYNNKNTHTGADADLDSWFFLDHIQLKLVEPEIKIVISADKDEYEEGEDITFTAVTDANVTRIGIANENGKLLGKKSQMVVDNDDGTRTWTIVASIATKGERTLSVSMDNGDGILADAGVTVDLVIKEPVLAESDDATIKESVKLPETAKKNEAFTVTVVTGTGVNKIGIFNEDGKALGKLSQTYVDEDGERTWTISISLGSRGTRNLTVKTADAAGNWVAAEAVTIKIK